ncbi:MAG: M48 family metalloprotease [Candidatus Aenigmatarchaeota archaeon]
MEINIFSWQEKLRRISKISLFFSALLLYFLIFFIVFSFFFVIFAGATGAIFFPDVLSEIIPILSFESLKISLIAFFIIVPPAFYFVYLKPSFIVDRVLNAEKPDLNNPLHKKAFDSFEKMKIAFGVRNAELRILDWNIINAMVITTKDKSYVYITKGALEKLEMEELDAVFAHEFSHVVHKDSYYLTLISVVAGLTVIISYFLIKIYPRILISLAFSASSSTSRTGRGRGGGGLASIGILVASAIVIVVGYILAIISPIIQRRLASSVSKKREFMADSKAVLVTKYPPALISVLSKISKEISNQHEFFKSQNIPKNIKMLLFNNLDIETHPPIEERIRVLSQIAKINPESITINSQ